MFRRSRLSRHDFHQMALAHQADTQLVNILRAMQPVLLRQV